MVGAGARGFALGVAWGAAARLWMRLISTEPEFTWQGTTAILVVAGVAGLGLGLIHAAKSQGRSRWWLLAFVMVLPLFASPGLPFLPSLVLGGLAFARRAVAWRVLGVGAVAGSIPLLVWFTGQDAGAGLPLVRGYGGFLVLAVAMAAGGSVLYRPPGWNEQADEQAVGPASRQDRQRKAGLRRAPNPESHPAPDHG